MSNKKKVFLVIDKHARGRDSFHKFLHNIYQKFHVTNRIKEAEFIFVLGGDGTMLKAIHKYLIHRLPFCGFNFGHVGFMMSGAHENILDEIAKGHNHVICQPLLRVGFFDKNGKRLDGWHALKDVYVRSKQGVAKIRIEVEDYFEINPLFCNRVIVSSAAGSIARNASASEKIITMGMNSFVVTRIPTAPYNKRRTKVIPAGKKITIEATQTNKWPVFFCVDNKKVPHANKAVISYGEIFVRIVSAWSENYPQKVVDMIRQRKENNF